MLNLSRFCRVVRRATSSDAEGFGWILHEKRPANQISRKSFVQGIFDSISPKKRAWCARYAELVLEFKEKVALVAGGFVVCDLLRGGHGEVELRR